MDPELTLAILRQLDEERRRQELRRPGPQEFDPGQEPRRLTTLERVAGFGKGALDQAIAFGPRTAGQAFGLAAALSRGAGRVLTQPGHPVSERDERGPYTGEIRNVHAEDLQRAADTMMGVEERFLEHAGPPESGAELAGGIASTIGLTGLEFMAGGGAVREGAEKLGLKLLKREVAEEGATRAQRAAVSGREALRDAAGALPLDAAMELEEETSTAKAVSEMIPGDSRFAPFGEFAEVMSRTAPGRIAFGAGLGGAADLGIRGLGQTAGAYREGLSAAHRAGPRGTAGHLVAPGRASTRIHTLLDGSEQLDLPDNPTLRDVGKALEERALARHGRILDLEQDHDQIVEILADETELALSDATNAQEWYREKLETATRLVAAVRPAIADDPIHLDAFRFALAVTSNGQEVRLNARYALEVYDEFAKTGRFPIFGKGQEQEAMKSAFQRWNRYADLLGEERLFRFMDTEFEVADLKRIGLNVDEAVGQRLPGSVIFGPKIGGGFYRNLGGYFDEVTMDRWFRRTIGRVTGDMLDKPGPKALRDSIARFRKTLGKDAPTDTDELLDIARGRRSEWERTYRGLRDEGVAASDIEKPEWAKAAERVVANYDPSIRDIPAKSSERKALRQIIRSVQDVLEARTGERYDAASVQAMLWYPEKRLFEGLGIRGRGDDIDYETAFRELLGDGDEASRLADVGRADGGAGRRLAGPGSTPARGGLAPGDERGVRRTIERANRRQRLADLRQSPDPGASFSRGVGGAGKAVLGAVRAVFEPSKAYKNAVGPLVGTPKIHEVTDPEKFHAAALRAQADHPMGPALTVHSPEDYAGMRVFLTHDGKAGFALRGDEIVSLFKHPSAQNRAWAAHALNFAVSQGGRRLDVFEIEKGAQHLYAEGGFETVGRMPFDDDYAPDGWNFETMGRPDVVTMRFNPANTEGIYRGGGDVFDDYDTMLAAARDDKRFGAMVPALGRPLVGGLAGAAGGAAVSDEVGIDPRAGALAGGLAGAGLGAATLRRGAAEAGGVRPDEGRLETFTSPEARTEVESPAPVREGVAPAFQSAPEPREPGVVSLRKAEGAAIRERLGLDQLPPPSRESFADAWEEASAANMAEHAVETAQVAAANRVPLRPAEHAAAVQRYIQLERDLVDSRSLLEEASRAGNDDVVQREVMRSNRILDQIDALTEATDRAGSEAGRALAVRRLRANSETYTLASGLQAARSKKRAPLTPEEVSNIEALTKRIDDLDAENQKLRAESEKVELGRKRAAAEAAVRTEAKARRKGGGGRGRRRRGAARSVEDLKVEEVELKRDLVRLGLKLNDVSGVSAEGLYLIGRLATNRIRQAVAAGSETVTLNRIVDEVLGDLNNPTLTRSDVYEALNTRNPDFQGRARSETQRQISELRAQARLLRKIEDAEKGIFEEGRKRPPRSAEIRRLQARLTELRNAAYKGGRESSRIEMAIRTINDLQDQLDNHHRAIRRKRPPPSQQLSDLRTRIRGLRQEMGVQDRLTDLEHQLRTGEFKVPVPRRQLYTTPQLERNQIALKRARLQWRQAIAEMEPPTVRKKVREGMDFLRTVKATADMSATLRQGLWLSVRRPGTAARSFGKAFRSFFSKYTADQIDNAMKQHPNQLIRDRAGLYLSDPGGGLGAREEFFRSELAEKIPGFGAVVQASERHFTTHLNLMRVAAFDDFIEKFPNATLDEQRAWANWVNVASGRGDLGPLRAVGTELAAVVFAPRFAASRIQTPITVFRHWQHPRVRKEIAKDYAAVVGLGMTTLAIADAAGLEVGLDPRDADWGKIRIGDTRIDIWAGVQQPARVVARIMLGLTDRLGLTGEHLTASEQRADPLTLLGRFAAFKLAPGVTTPLELWTGRTAVGERVTPSQTAVRAALPLIYEDIYDAYRLEGPGKAALVGGLQFLGVGATTYSDNQTKTRRNVREALEGADLEEAMELTAKWNERNPDTPIRGIRLRSTGQTVTLSSKDREVTLQQVRDQMNEARR